MSTAAPTRTVLVVGAGIAGPALAYWLNRYGLHPTVVERAPGIRGGGGHLVDVRGPAVDVVERMGILPHVRAARTRTRLITVVDARGRPVSSITPAQFAGPGAGRDVELPRGDLTSMLYDHTKNDNEYIFDDSITKIEQNNDGVQVTFRRGRPRLFDLVVGADGTHSDVRTFAFGPEQQFNHHLGYYYAALSVPNHLGLVREARLYNTPGKMMALSAIRDVGDVSAALVFSAPQQTGLDHRDDTRQRRLVAETFQGTGWEVPRLLEALPTAKDFYFDSISQIRMPYWTSRRLALVGDAACAPSLLSGQGTSVALLGAYVLAGELAAANGDTTIALPAYEQQLRGFARQNQRSALSGARALVPPTRTQIWLRNQALRAVPYLTRMNPGRATNRASTALTLPEYRRSAPEPRP